MILLLWFILLFFWVEILFQLIVLPLLLVLLLVKSKMAAPDAHTSEDNQLAITLSIAKMTWGLIGNFMRVFCRVWLCLRDWRLNLINLLGGRRVDFLHF